MKKILCASFLCFQIACGAVETTFCLDYLLWFANQDGLGYATIANTATTATSNLSYDERDRILNPGFYSGARGQVIFKPSESSWDTRLSYIYYHARSEGSSSANSQSIISSGATSEGSVVLSDPTFLLFQQSPGEINYQVWGNWLLNFNRCDWEVGKDLSFGPHFTLRPFFGLQGVSIDQSFREKFQSIYLSQLNGALVLDTIHIQNKNLFLGIGSAGGFQGTCHLGRGFSLYGVGMGSILWGHFKIKQSYEQDDLYSTGQSANLGKETIDHSHFASIFNWDLGIGFFWKHPLQKGRYLLTLKCGWEQHFYTNINRYQDFYFSEMNGANVLHSSDRNLQKGNLSLSGFSFGGALQF